MDKFSALCRGKKLGPITANNKEQARRTFFFQFRSVFLDPELGLSEVVVSEPRDLEAKIPERSHDNANE